MEVSIVEKFLTLGIPLVIAVVLHEVAHGWVAWKLGDPTAKALGRITLNPLKHVDPMMTIFLPTLLILSNSPVVFGGAKPVPINPRYFNNPRIGMVYVAAAGPITNFVLAGIFGLTLHILLQLSFEGSDPVLVMRAFSILLNCVMVNLVLGLFNLVPVPPLDGGRIAVGLLPTRIAAPLAKLERFGLLIVFALLYTGVIENYLRVSIFFVARTIGIAI